MADLYDLIERVQVTLASSRRPEQEQLRDLHGALTDQIRRANRRLRECDDLLAKGHRTEAIQLAEQDPPLLDVVAILDFAEMPEWNDFVAELDLPVAPELQIEIAADLNRAYSDDAPLEQHLRRLRLYSLARSPLRTRIALLQKIAALDAGNPVWESDRRSYEEVRLRQIHEEFQTANRNRDLETLRELSAELRRKWLVKPGKQMIGRVNQAIKVLQGEAVLKRLAQITRDLNDARDDDDLGHAAELAAEWGSVAKSFPDSDEVRDLRTQARKTLEWVKEQKGRLAEKDDFKRAVQRLRRAVDSGHDLTELERRYKAVSRFRSSKISPAIQDEYEQAVRECRRRRKLRLIIAASSIAGGAVIIGVLFLIWKLGS
ncbi:MAG: hypothetical protein ACE5KM_10235 [Planctomycetaceae bacterium]